MENLQTRCCIAGGGPAGTMLGYLLARAGIDVVVLEKYPDFFRDFRGDTIHPSTMQVLHELGLLEDFLKLPMTKHARLPRISAARKSIWPISDGWRPAAPLSRSPRNGIFSISWPRRQRRIQHSIF